MMLPVVADDQQRVLVQHPGGDAILPGGVPQT